MKFANGEDVEPEDWVWSLYRARDYELSNYRFIAEAIDTVEATDEQVIIHLSQPNAGFMAMLGCFNMVLGDKSYAESMTEEEYLKKPMGTGPYMLKEWNQGTDMTLEANPYYREEGMPKTKELKYVLVADDNPSDAAAVWPDRRGPHLPPQLGVRCAGRPQPEVGCV